MSKFKDVPQLYLFRKLMEFWGNVVKNFDRACRDNDFFEIVDRSCPHDKAVELIEAAYKPSFLAELENMRGRRGRLDLSDSLNVVFYALWNAEDGRDACRGVLGAIREFLLLDCRVCPGDPVERRFAEIQRVFRLSDLELDILLLAYIAQESCFEWPTRLDTREKPLYFAMALDRSYGEVSEAMGGRGRLRKYGLLDSDWDFNRRTLGSFMDGSSTEAIERRYYKKSELADILPWEFFGELSEKDGEVIRRMVSACSGKCNILLYGAPGTGKTSFARALAGQIGRTAFEIKQGDDDGKNMKSEARMVGIQICNEQEKSDESLMIVDEADELLRGSSCAFSLFGFDMGGKSTEKGVMNSILDEMKMPAIWISNAPAREMDESVRRRFDYSVCFERMNNAQRVSIWKNLVAKHGLAELVTDEKIDAYAAKYQTSAGGISTVLENVRRMKPSAEKVDELVETLMKPHCRLMGITESGKFLPAKGYSLDGLNVKGKVAPAKIVRAVGNYLDSAFNAASEDKPRMNVLLFGPPGTGKTEFVKYLGKELGRKVIVMKGSDLLSKWVGESEQNIAQAFRRAESERAILFFDEIDGLLQSRESATASWQVTQVNEILQQMENFDGVMVAATNFCRNLDAAVMRRFTFKLEFDYLDSAGRKSFFERMFKTELTRDELAELDELQNLAPGDFRTVRQEQFYLDESPSNAERIAALREECALKRDGRKTSRIGF